MTPYKIFMSEERPKYQQNHPELPMTIIFAEVAKIWMSLNSEQKIPYVNKSEADRTRFQEESETFIRQRFQHSSNKYDPRM